MLKTLETLNIDKQLNTTLYWYQHFYFYVISISNSKNICLKFEYQLPVLNWVLHLLKFCTLHPLPFSFSWRIVTRIYYEGLNQIHLFYKGNTKSVQRHYNYPSIFICTPLKSNFSKSHAYATKKFLLAFF